MGFPSVRQLVLVCILMLVWCVLWGEFSLANVVSGVTLAVVIQVFGLGPPAAGGISALPLVRFGWLVFVDLFASSWVVLREVLTPTDYTDESIIAVQVEPDARAHLLLLTLAITVTPGTAVVDTDPEDGILYVHILHDERRAATIAHIHALATLAARALTAASTTRERA